MAARIATTSSTVTPVEDVEGRGSAVMMKKNWLKVGEPQGLPRSPPPSWMKWVHS